jgi:phosphoglycolate phosphatase-like HAD superfamily hydrolase
VAGPAGATRLSAWLRLAPTHADTVPLSHFETVLLDVDGTLLDSDAAQADAWAHALHSHGLSVNPKALRQSIGMSDGQLLHALAQVSESSPLGRGVVARKRQVFATLLPGLAPTRGARALLEHLGRRGLDLGLATAAPVDEVRAGLQRAGVADLLRASLAVASDMEASTDGRDVVESALERCGARPDRTVMIGNTPHDIEAAARAGVRAVALRCGGFWTDGDLRHAIAIYDHPEALLAQWRVE